MIAMALACRPKVLIADEPITALDVTIQTQIVTLVRDLQQELGMAVIWITHDLGVVASLADRVAVMYAGRRVSASALRHVVPNLDEMDGDDRALGLSLHRQYDLALALSSGLASHSGAVLGEAYRRDGPFVVDRLPK